MGFYYETSIDASLAGYERGVAHAQRALEWLRELGVLEGLPVYYTVDIDASTSQLRGPITRYFQGIRSVVSLEQIRCYGGYYQVKYLLDSGLAVGAVQTEAWSYLDEDGNVREDGQLTWHPGAEVHQWTEHAASAVAGLGCDSLDIVGDIAVYHPEGNDMYTEQDRVRDKYTYVRTLALGFDTKILKARLDGATPEVVAKLEADKAKAVQEERVQLGLEKPKG